MAAEDLNLSGIRTLDQAMARTRNGAAAIELSTKLGLWTSSAHAATQVRAPFPFQLSELTPGQLSDLYARWTAEFGRVAELLGAINGQEQLLKIQLKSAQAAARARIRRANPDIKYTQGQLADLSDEEQSVIDLVEQQGLLGVLSAQASAAKEVNLQYLNTISREISFRDAQLKARVYA
jgi:hypothetical protein